TIRAWASTSENCRISSWQAIRAPMIFAPTIGAAIRAGYWFLRVRCPACRMVSAIDLRKLDRHPDAAVTSLIPTLSCRSCRPNAPFAGLVRLSRTSIADEMREEYRRQVWASNPGLNRSDVFRLAHGFR